MPNMKDIELAVYEQNGIEFCNDSPVVYKTTIAESNGHLLLIHSAYFGVGRRHDGMLVPRKT
jgi:hypothetical protein